MKKIILIIVVIMIVFLTRTKQTKNEVQNIPAEIKIPVNVANTEVTNILENTQANLTPTNTSNTFADIANIVKNIPANAQPKEQIKDTLAGKNIAFIGDSLIEGYGNDFHGFDYYLAQELPNTRFINNSKSGSTITDNSGSDNIIMINQAKTLTGSPDIIVLDGGANDIMGYALGFLNNDLKKEIGTVNMTPNSVTQGESVIADLEEVLTHLKNTFPNAKFCYLQPFLLDNETISHLTTENALKQEIIARRDSFYAEVQKLCKKWNMEYLDISHNFVGTGTTYRQNDWIHINEAGYKLLTPHLLNKLKEM